MGHNRAQIRRGKTAEAYAANGSGPRAFADLAGLCVTERDARQLVALIAAHRKADPDDPDLATWDVEAKMLAEDYAGALALLTAQRETLSRTPRFSAKFDRHLVHSLVKLKRHDEAVREAEKLIKQNRLHGRLLLILTYASAGQVKEAMRVAAEPPLDRYLLSDCYHDVDLGPLLRGDALRAFRERFPEPPADELDPDDDDRF
jgi:hypothetical protein